jgi:competence protein ComEA
MNRQTFLIVVTALLLAVGGSTATVWAAEERTPRPAATKGERININTASEEELRGLTGVGRVVARRIVEYRQANGGFKTPEDIQKVEGVGRRIWEQNRDRIAVK